MDGHSPTCSARPERRNETRPEVAQDETQINTQPPTIIDHRAVRVSGLLRTAADICANVGDIKPWMIGFLLSAKVNDNNKGRTRAADRMYRKEKKAKSTAACACMGPWPTAPYHLETESSQWLQTVLFWARRRTQKRCAQFHGSVHTRNITAGRSMTAEKGVEEPGKGAGESWWCPFADWTGGNTTTTTDDGLLTLIHRPGGRWIRYGMLLCGTVRSNSPGSNHSEWKGSGPQ
ncbi:uncharacterized protein BO88DRAFT_426349 [Aspergillus vadensis CBS 113365]|uniref:Uncharacterized protein n=1 Tax=Aspergillus vadensis (strain CBS 113365 / IMI 142717 / IBT 24658) TaxID=1448311 RepID=A0A319BR40_ASPVC|nr:hypothetical protein BO88DRAFT_426349 [Aspergillus vadensis CBS 113365]PYH68243.1 hypothetical protein BO88DRAFT_426349 [Aspergillus vadensis CBS 113365]